MVAVRPDGAQGQGQGNHCMVIAEQQTASVCVMVHVGSGVCYLTWQVHCSPWARIRVSPPVHVVQCSRHELPHVGYHEVLVEDDGHGAVGEACTLVLLRRRPPHWQGMGRGAAPYR